MINKWQAFNSFLTTLMFAASVCPWANSKEAELALMGKPSGSTRVVVRLTCKTALRPTYTKEWAAEIEAKSIRDRTDFRKRFAQRLEAIREWASNQTLSYRIKGRYKGVLTSFEDAKQRRTELIQTYAEVLFDLGEDFPTLSSEIEQSTQYFLEQYRRSFRVRFRNERDLNWQDMQDLHSDFYMAVQGQLGELNALAFYGDRVQVQNVLISEIPALKFLARTKIQKMIQSISQFEAMGIDPERMASEEFKKFEVLFSRTPGLNYRERFRRILDLEIDLILWGAQKPTTWVEVKTLAEPLSLGALLPGGRREKILDDLLQLIELRRFLGLEAQVEIEAFFTNGIDTSARKFLEDAPFYIKVKDGRS